MKIYTRTGDEGETSFFGGGRAAKSHPRVAAYGDVDELNAALLSALVSAFERSEGPDFPARVAARAAVKAAKGYAELVRRDEGVTAALKRRTESRACYWGTIPELADDIHDLTGVARVANLIFGRNGEETSDGDQGHDQKAPEPRRT